jgi:hypothetical protein
MISQRLEVIHELNALSANPLARVSVESASVIVELTDEVTMIRLRFHPYQSVRVTTADCFALSGDMFITPRTLMEVRDSNWIDELRKSQALVDETATFMDKARHFVIPCDDNFIEVVAWEWERTN